MKKINFIQHLLFIVISLFLICKFPSLQQHLYPKKYWKEKVFSLQMQLQKDEYRLNYFLIELEKEKANKIFKEKQALVKVNFLKQNEKECFLRKTQKRHLRDLQLLERKILETKDLYQKHENLLQNVMNNYQKHELE